jgi:hypothetical protein
MAANHAIGIAPLASPPPLAAELGFTRVRPLYQLAEVGNIRLRLEGQGGGRHQDSYSVAHSPPLPRLRGREQAAAGCNDVANFNSEPR